MITIVVGIVCFVAGGFVGMIAFALAATAEHIEES